LQFIQERKGVGMKFFKQLNRHDPASGVWGDCWRTALGCLFDLEPAEVPHFLDGGPDPDVFIAHYKSWLAERGFCTFQVCWNTDLESVLSYMRTVNPGVYYLLSGMSPRSTTHVVIGLDDQIVHDPAIDGGGLIAPCAEDGFYWVEVLIPITVHKAAA
jgi:hypothetical protein